VVIFVHLDTVHANFTANLVMEFLSFMKPKIIIFVHGQDNYMHVHAYMHVQAHERVQAS
jgi:mRNA degradation ribonuclease J1/J2